MNFFNSELSSEQIKRIDALVVELLASTTEIVSVVVIDFYGQLIASSEMSADDETKALAKYAFELFSRSDAVARQMSHDKLEQIVASTNEGYLMIVADFGAGILASFGRASEASSALESR